MKAFNITKTLFAPLATITTAMIVSACGAAPSVDPSTAATSSSSTSTGSTIISPIVTTSPTPTITSTTNPLAPITTSFTVRGANPNPQPTPAATGSTSFSFSVNTDNLLQVTITAGGAAPVIPNSNFVATYDCISYQITAAGDTVTTNYLSVNGGSPACEGAASSQTIDFSSNLTTGHGPVTITVSAVDYDFYFLDCLNEPWYYSYACYTQTWMEHPVFSNHGVTGTLSVAINGSD